MKGAFDMSKTVATIIGVVFVLVGILGFASPHLLGAHFSPAHNIIHLVTGALSLYFGLKGSLSSAALFSIVFGAVYLLLGVAGYVVGTGPDHIFRVVPETLVFGTMDHIIHLLLGAIYLVVGIYNRASITV